MRKRRVVVTGAGLVTAAGLSLKSNWEAIKNGSPAIARIDRFYTEGFTVKLGGAITGFDGAVYLKNRRHIRFLRSSPQFCLAAVQLALEDAGLVGGGFDPAVAGLYVGSGEPEVHYDAFFGAIDHSLNESGDISPKKFGLFGMQALSPSFLLLDLMNNGFCYSAIEHGIMGPNNTFSGGLAGGQAVGQAFQAVQTGEVDFAVAGGHDSLLSCFENYYLYHATGLVTQEGEPDRAMKPYSAGRDGFVLGEGAGFLVLEEWGRAMRRGAPLWGEVIGYGCACDTNPDLLRPSPDGAALRRALEAALHDAAVLPSRIDYINGDGLATPEHDQAETRALKHVFAAAGYRIPVSAVKPVIGHTGAAAAAIDCIVSLMALREQTIPPTAHFCGGDPECDLDYVGGRFRSAPLQYIVSVNQGLGGQCCAFVLQAVH